jgi:prophage antirepressor-like protein
MKFVTIDGESWRVLADVCDVLGHSNPSMAVRTLDNDEHDVLTPSAWKLANGSLA